jgi:hypothetical protein
MALSANIRLGWVTQQINQLAKGFGFNALSHCAILAFHCQQNHLINNCPTFKKRKEFQLPRFLEASIARKRKD